MASSGSVASNLAGTILTFTDTSVDLPPITSRVLTIYSPTGELLDTIDMDGSLTADYAITNDQWVQFILTLNVGAYIVTVNVLAENIYYNGLVNETKSNCGCGNNSLCSDSAKAMMSERGAVFYNMYGFAVNSDKLIKVADALIL